MRALALLLLLGGPAMADTLRLPDIVERAGSVDGVYVVDPPRAGGGTLVLEWTDALGRVVQRSTQAAEGDAVPVRLDAGRAVAMANRVRARLERGGVASAAEHRFIARPPARPWDDFHIIMYQDQEAPALAGLRGLGISGVRVFGHRVAFTDADVAARTGGPLGADLRWYVENIATDFYSPYHMWTPEHPVEVHWRFLEAQARHRRDPSDLGVFERVPSLSDAGWMGRIQARLGEHVRAHGPYRPFYYSLGDEPGIADLAAAWDFDRSAVSLGAFRAWLRARHGTLEALNAAWGSAFASWEAVLPEGTTAAMARKDDNFAAWNDHKAFMDASFGAALRAGTDAVHAADPAALSGIEGGQIPGWGGWDYGQVAPAVDVMEIYEAGQNVAIARSLNPKLVTLATSAGSGPEARRQIWRAVFQGAGGLILWDEDSGVIRPDGTPGPRGMAEGPLFRELTGGLGARLAASASSDFGVAVLYSPASFRLQWLLDHRGRGDAWTDRSSEAENEDNAVRAAMRAVAGALATSGITPRWITHEQLAEGVLQQMQARVLVLPGVLALSDAEAAVIVGFASGGGTVLAEGETGSFDGSARRRRSPALARGVAAPMRPGAIEAAFAAAGRRVPLALPESLTAAGPPTVMVRRDGAVQLVGIVAARPGHAEHDIPAPPGVVRDLRGDDGWRPVVGGSVKAAFDADGVALLAFAPGPTPGPEVTVQPRVLAGETAWAHVRVPNGAGTFRKVVRVELRDPAGRVVPAYSGNVTLLGPSGRGWPVPFAVNDAAGEWTLWVRDILGGGVASARVNVVAAP